MLTHPLAQPVEKLGLVFAGGFKPFPRLTVGCLEPGWGWVPYLLDRRDEQWSPGGHTPPRQRPSASLRACPVYDSAEPHERALPLAVALLRTDHCFCAWDYPHELGDASCLAHLLE